MLGEWCSRKTHLKHHFWVLDVSTTLCAKDCWSSSEAKVASGNSQSFPRRPNKIVPINVSAFDRSNWCVFTVIAKDVLAVWEEKVLHQKEMSIFSLFRFWKEWTQPYENEIEYQDKEEQRSVQNTYCTLFNVIHLICEVHAFPCKWCTQFMWCLHIKLCTQFKSV